MKTIIVLQTAEDANAFIAEAKHRKGRSLADFLKLKGRDSTILADTILCFAKKLVSVYDSPTDKDARIYARSCDLCLDIIYHCKARFQVTLLIKTNIFKSYLE